MVEDEASRAVGRVPRARINHDLHEIPYWKRRRRYHRREIRAAKQVKGREARWSMLDSNRKTTQTMIHRSPCWAAKHQSTLVLPPSSASSSKQNGRPSCYGASLPEKLRRAVFQGP